MLVHHNYCYFLSFFCSAFQALMQWTHWPPFLKWGQITFGYLLDVEILLSASDGSCEALTELACSSSCFKPAFSMCSSSSYSWWALFSNFSEFIKAVSSDIYISLPCTVYWYLATYLVFLLLASCRAVKFAFNSFSSLVSFLSSSSLVLSFSVKSETYFLCF